MTQNKIYALFKLLRPIQWVKNAFVIAPLFFSLKFTSFESWQSALIAVLSFILISSATYIMNDIHDVDEDRAHPIKKRRPIASGMINKSTAATLAFVLLCSAGVLLLLLPNSCSAILAIYVLVQFLYTNYFKEHAIIDVLVIASGYVFRILMGAYAIGVPVSPWIILSTYLLALFLGFGKRFHEFSIDSYNKYRPSIQNYNETLLRALINICCAATIMCYALYTVEMAHKLNKVGMVYTCIFVIFGMFRYLQVLYMDKRGGEPEKILLGDKMFFANVVLWLGVTLYIIAA